MKILLTGAGGMLGYAFRQVFEGEELFAFTKEELDITNHELVLAKIGGIRPDFVVNCAAYTNVDEAEDNRDQAIAINADALRNLVEACSTNVSFLIHFSTDYVFDGESEEAYKEDHAKNPINVYGESKSLGENVIIEGMEDYAIFRTSWLFGPNGKNFVDTMLKLSEDRDELRIVNDQKGCPTYTFDLAEAVYNFMKAPQTGIFHLTNDTTLTWYEFAGKIFDTAHRSVDLIPVSSEEFVRNAKRPKNSVLINSKLDKLPKIEDALKRYLIGDR